MTRLDEVPFTRVRIQDRFWSPRRLMNRAVSLPHSLDMLEKAGNIHNFEAAARHEHSGFIGPVFMDSDVYKTLEAVSYTLATDPDPALERRVDGIIAKIAAAQMPDGYLDTYYEINAPDRRFTNLRDHHELYCAGHLIEAAVAHYRATGKRTLLDVAIKLANHIASVFGDGPGKRMGYPGHPEIELALVKLWQVTADRRYLDLARFFVVNRGSHFFATEHHTPPDRYDGTYWLDETPIRDLQSMVGHAVRAGYLLSGATDVARETGDPGLLRMLQRVWTSTTSRRMYVTGGIGSSGSNEGFTTDYDLPNLTAYQETCASVAMAMWNHRLNLLFGDGKYADIVELCLYNAILDGVSLDGKNFFYGNPLASLGDYHRSGWFSCACCPPNEARTLSQLGNYAYATSPNGLWVNLYIQGGVTAQVAGRSVDLDVTTNYPWDGKVRLVVKPDAPAEFQLRLRIPGWCTGATVAVQGDAQGAPQRSHGYFVLNRTWRPGDVVDLDLPMPVRRVAANPNVAADRGRLVIARGPLIYCVEACDQRAPISSVGIPADAAFDISQARGLPAGFVALKTVGLAASSGWPGGLYHAAPAPRRVSVTAIPYFAWDNRAPGAMEVWVPTAPPPPLGGGPERRAAVSISFQNSNCRLSGINNGADPRSSSEQPAALCHWWPHKGGQEWVQYTWRKPITINLARVYWFDDTGRGECRLPVSWRLLALSTDGWKAVELTDKRDAYPVEPDRWCEAHLTPVTTTAMRLVVDMRPGWSAGVRQWRVETTEP